jgi:amidophosphoribosyltransferase
MCGIFGVYGHKDAAALTQLGLYSLQHRGQESAGIVAVDDERPRAGQPRMGLVSEGFEDAEMARCAARSRSGTRATTAGSSAIENAQPVLARVRVGSHRARAQRQSHERRAELRRSARGRGRDLLEHDGLGGHRASHRPRQPASRPERASPRRCRAWRARTACSWCSTKRSW